MDSGRGGAVFPLAGREARKINKPRRCEGCKKYMLCKNYMLNSRFKNDMVNFIRVTAAVLPFPKGRRAQNLTMEVFL